MLNAIAIASIVGFEASLIALAGALGCIAVFFVIVTRLPGDGREQERLAAMRKARAAREAAAKTAE